MDYKLTVTEGSSKIITVKRSSKKNATLIRVHGIEEDVFQRLYNCGKSIRNRQKALKSYTFGEVLSKMPSLKSV